MTSQSIGDGATTRAGAYDSLAVTPREQYEQIADKAFKLIRQFATGAESIVNQQLYEYNKVIVALFKISQDELAIFREWEHHARNGSLTEQINEEIMNRLSSLREDQKKQEKELLKGLFKS